MFKRVVTEDWAVFAPIISFAIIGVVFIIVTIRALRMSKGNRDLHTTRSAEVPFIGTPAFCGERTSEHTFLFTEGIEAVFWNNAEECASQCRGLLAQPARIAQMAEAARRRIIAHRLSNDEVLQHCVEILRVAP